MVYLQPGAEALLPGVVCCQNNGTLDLSSFSSTGFTVASSLVACQGTGGVAGLYMSYRFAPRWLLVSAVWTRVACDMLSTGFNTLSELLMWLLEAPKLHVFARSAQALSRGASAAGLWHAQLTRGTWCRNLTGPFPDLWAPFAMSLTHIQLQGAHRQAMEVPSTASLPAAAAAADAVPGLW